MVKPAVELGRRRGQEVQIGFTVEKTAQAQLHFFSPTFLGVTVAVPKAEIKENLDPKGKRK
jgi:hypothetical protein